MEKVLFALLVIIAVLVGVMLLKTIVTPSPFHGFVVSILSLMLFLAYVASRIAYKEMKEASNKKKVCR